MFGKKSGSVSEIKKGVSCSVCNDQGHIYEGSNDTLEPCPRCGEEGDGKPTPSVEDQPVALTQGQYLVGYDFNPSGREDVADVKLKTAYLMDMLHEFMLAQMEEAGNDAAGRCAAVALSKYEEACMWAVKALTKPPMEF